MNTNKALYEVPQVKNFKELIDNSVELYPLEPAFKLRDENGEIFDVTYTAFKDDIYALGTAITDMGWLGKQTAIMGQNSYNWVTTYLAVQIGGGAVVPIDKELYFDDINNILTVSETDIFFLDKKSYGKIENHLDDLTRDITFIILDAGKDETEHMIFSDLLENGKNLVKAGSAALDTYSAVDPDPNVMSVLSFTSGTSGLTKGVMLSQGNIVFAVMSNCSVAKCGPGDQYLSVCPCHHTMEMTEGILIPLYCGCCIAFNDSLLHLMKNFQDFKPTIFVCVPLMMEKFWFRIMAAVSEKKGGKLKLTFGKLIAEATNVVGINMNDKIFEEITKNFGGRLRLFVVGGAAVPPQPVKDFKTFGIDSYIGYGMTECAPLIACNHDALFTTDSVGKPIPGVDVKIINANEEGIGEVCVKGPNVMLGYYKDEALTAETIDADGYIHTGDIGSLDEDGILRLNGRIKNVIVTKNGKNIYPEELEFHLNSNPLVAESMVVGFEDIELEDTIVEAKIFPDFEAIKKKAAEKGKEVPTGKDLEKLFDDMVKELNKKLPNYKNIKKVTLRENEFIKTTTMKIKRYANMDDEAKES